MRTDPAEATTTYATNGTREDLPVLEVPHELPPQDARALSKVFLRELAAREEGTEGHQYVRNTLIEMNMSLVVYAAGRFRARGDETEDVVQVGMIGLIKAIDRFDLSREVEFATFAVPYIVGEIKRFFRDTTWAVHVPRRLQEARVELAKATDELSSRLGRAPLIAELAPVMELSEDQVVEAQVAANGYNSTSLDARIAGGGDEDEDAALGDLLGQEDPALALFEEFHTLAPLVEALGERDRLLLHLRFVEELTQTQIGERLGVSQMHVSRLLARSLKRLREGMVEPGTDG
ncbi:RNA polymerase sigma factor SigF [Streptomyces zaomyceticus]|uniref:RNA polymerase sigma factor SigF n=1 Tax=Streptomyces zaomyceticus TaxID=68286 RepID=UPI00167BC28E|nr:RNA polymerase sigma factor SigF [Streptomyces zaomyceticus]GHG22242.1 RNA polymerase sigma factor [Streptomyces zaomyceticus]